MQNKMNLEYIESPVPHIIIHDLFNEEDVKLIWRELEFLTHPEKLLPPEKSRSAKENGFILKQNHAIFLEDVYKNPAHSDIFRSINKVFTKEFFEQVSEKNSLFEWTKQVNNISFLVSYYDENNSYLPHKDNAVYTLLIHFYKEPQAFTGGELTLGTVDYKIPLENNRLILFPSWAKHGVTPVKFKEKQQPLSGNGRYTISIFFYIHNIVPQS